MDGDLAGLDDGDRDAPPRAPAHGLNAFDLADYVQAFSEYSQHRILTIGAKQYDLAGKQKFEQYDITQLCDQLLEELADVGNYAAMLAIKVDRIKRESERWTRVPF